jgi:hypothetical protein
MITHRLAVLSLTLLLAAGCSRSKTYSTPEGSVTVHDNGKPGQSAVTITGNNGEKMTINSEGAKLPDGYPKDVPVASGAKIVMATSVDNKTTHGSYLVLESADSLEKNLAFYKQGLADNGWKIDATVSQPQITIISATKDTRELSLSLQQAEGKCTVTQSVAVKN